jgi:long-chain acyl-CoA synthetase
MSNLADLLTETARAHGAQTALLHDGSHVSYAELDELAARFAGLFAGRGTAVGDRVAILLPNEPAFVGAYYGALRTGAIAVPLNPLLRRGEIASRVEDAQARLLVAAIDRANELEGLGAELVNPSDVHEAEPSEEIAARAPGDSAVLLYTSGTSGGAKGAELTHAGLRANASFLGGPVLGLTPDDVVLGSTPLSHVLGQSGVMNAAIASGACVRLMPRFEPEATLRAIADDGAHVFLGVPTMCNALLQAAAPLANAPQLRVAHVGGAPLPPEILRAFAARFGCPVLEGYGMTEVGTATSHRLGGEVRPGSVGPAADGIELRVVGLDGEVVPAGEVGEVLVRGRWLMRGYWRSLEATLETIDPDGWLATGDMGYLDDDGYLYLVDRKKDVILRGGYSVYPREIEDVLHEHPAVQEVAVVGVPHESLGEEVVALVVPTPGTACDPEELMEFARAGVAAYKYPRLVVVTERLPRGPTGKLLKREIDRGSLQAALQRR